MWLYPFFLNLDFYYLLDAFSKGHWKILLWVPRYNILGAARASFTLGKRLMMSNISNSHWKSRWGVGASLSLLLCYLHQVRLISDRYLNKEKRDMLGGINITQIEVITVTRREQLCIFMKNESFGDNYLHWFHRWVRFIREGSETHVFEYREEKK